MRDVLVTAFIFGSIPFIFRRPWIGILMWVWISVMSPHRLTWGFAFNMPFAMVIALVTMLALLLSTQKHKFPFTGVTYTLIAMAVWMNVSTLFAIHPEMANVQWAKVMKIQLMIFVSLYLLSPPTKLKINALAWVLAGSMAFYGVKGGIFTVLGGGAERVWGPPGSFIEDNNALCLAIVMTIPLLYYLSGQVPRVWQRWGLYGAMVLCGFSALGSHSRGGLLGVLAMAVFLWLKSRHKIRTLVILAAIVPAMLGFMPEKWTERMETIGDYQEDGSAQGRLNAWMMAINLVKDRPLVGGGFDLYSEYTYGRWAPDPLDIRSSHSNYFQMLGEHGIPGLVLFLLLLLLTWRSASYVIAKTRDQPDLTWARDLCRMIQVSLIAYSVSGAFLNLGYFDLPYYMISLVVLTRVYVDSKTSAKHLAPVRDSMGRLLKRPQARTSGTPQAS